MNAESRNEGSVSEREIQHLETLHHVAFSSLRRQVDTFNSIEEKVWRHAALLGIVLGAFAVGAPTALETIRQNAGVGCWGFTLSYFGALLVSAVGLYCFMMAMRYEVLYVDPITESFTEEQVEKGYPRSLVSLTKGAIKHYFENQRRAFQRKLFWARWGWKSLPIVMVLVAIAFAFFVALTL